MAHNLFIVGFFAGFLSLVGCYAPFKAKTTNKAQDEKPLPFGDSMTKAFPSAESQTANSKGDPGPIALPYSHPEDAPNQNSDPSISHQKKNTLRSVPTTSCEDKDPAPLYYSAGSDRIIYCQNGRWTPISSKAFSQLRKSSSNHGLKYPESSSLNSETPRLEVLLPDGKRKKVVRSRKLRVENSVNNTQKGLNPLTKTVSPENYRCRPTDESKSNFHCFPSAVAH